MIIRVVNSVDTRHDFWPSYSFLLYIVLHVMTFVLIFSAINIMHAENSDIFNKYNRMQQIMIIVVASCSYPIVLIKFMQQLLGLWIINYTIFLLYLAVLIFRCATIGFKLPADIILDVDTPEYYNQSNMVLLAVLLLWFLTLEYSIKIDTSLPKRIWIKWIHCPIQSAFLKIRDMPVAVVNTIKKDTDSDIISISSSLPSYRTEELPSYSTNAVQPNLPPLYEEADLGTINMNNSSNEQTPVVRGDRVEENLNRTNINETPSQQYKTVFRETDFFFLWFSIEYKVPVHIDGA